jgi:site-specific DNA-cytosine methylase
MPRSHQGPPAGRTDRPPAPPSSAGIGGNRKLWDGDIEITAVEIDPKIAKIYQDFFPNDKVIVSDAHQYLLEHFKEYDFIWSSPPCPTHSRMRFLIVGWGRIGALTKS